MSVCWCSVSCTTYVVLNFSVLLEQVAAAVSERVVKNAQIRNS